MNEGERQRVQQAQADLNRTSVEVLLTDSQLMLTFLSIAETAENKESAKRNIRNARKAYDSIQHLRPRYVLTELQTSTLDAHLREAKPRLEALGESF